MHQHVGVQKETMDRNTELMLDVKSAVVIVMCTIFIITINEILKFNKRPILPFNTYDIKMSPTKH
jgi:hypothetical protein